jgi:hypothetical protein
VVATLVAVLGFLVAGASPSLASGSASYCNGRSQVSLVKTYTYGSQQLALRCGTSTWGFVHIKPRWNATFDSMIALTIARGEKVTDLQQDGGSKIFALFDGSCHELFRAYYSPSGGIVIAPNRAAPSIAEATTYRTDCAVIQNI